MRSCSAGFPSLPCRRPAMPPSFHRPRSPPPPPQAREVVQTYLGGRELLDAPRAALVVVGRAGTGAGNGSSGNGSIHAMRLSAEAQEAQGVQEAQQPTTAVPPELVVVYGAATIASRFAAGTQAVRRYHWYPCPSYLPLGLCVVSTNSCHTVAICICPGEFVSICTSPTTCRPHLSTATLRAQTHTMYIARHRLVLGILPLSHCSCSLDVRPLPACTQARMPGTTAPRWTVTESGSSSSTTSVPWAWA